MAELRMTADAETATPAAGAKRTVAASEKKGLAIHYFSLLLGSRSEICAV